MNLVLIPCAGSHTRWSQDTRDKPSIKQLAPVAGVPLLARLCSQVHQHGHLPVIVARDQLVFEPHFYPAQSQVLAATIQSTLSLWHGRVFVLLGDVVFSEQALSSVLSNRHPLQFFGSRERGDLYGFAIDSTCPLTMAMFTAALSRVLEAQRNGMLWEVFRACCGFALDDHKFCPFLYTDIHDEWTMDFDYVDHWLDWNKRWEAKSSKACESGARQQA